MPKQPSESDQWPGQPLINGAGWSPALPSESCERGLRLPAQPATTASTESWLQSSRPGLGHSRHCSQLLESIGHATDAPPHFHKGTCISRDDASRSAAAVIISAQGVASREPGYASRSFSGASSVRRLTRHLPPHVHKGTCDSRDDASRSAAVVVSAQGVAKPGARLCFSAVREL